MACLVAATAWSSGLGSPRIAIFSKDADLEALLTANLKECEILSRSQIPDAAAEAARDGKPLNLNGANVALILEPSGNETSVRLVSVSSGATIANWIAPKLPKNELSRWIALRAGAYLSEFPREDSARISLVGLRFETDSATLRGQERQANLMLAAELQTAGAIVLERWRMGDLVFEKTLLPEDSAFWKDATLVDGSLKTTSAGYSAAVRLRQPGGEDRHITLEASSLENLVRQIALQTFSLPTDIPRDRQMEPDTFLTECRWMLANGMHREAWQAAEAAIALGAQGREPQMLRVKAAAMTAYPDDLQVMHGMPGGYDPRSLPREEMEARMAAATEAMLLARDYLVKNSPCQPPGRWSLEHPPTLAAQSLYTGLRLLRKAWDSGWAADHPEAVQSLRQAVQRNIPLIQEEPLSPAMWSTFQSYLASMAAYWNSSPAETITFYRDVLRRDFPGGHSHWPQAIRKELFYNNLPYPPFLTGGAPKEDFPFGSGYSRVIDGQGQSALEAWEGYLAELATSPDPLARADALAFRWHSTADLAARRVLTSEMVEFLHAEFPALCSKDGPAIFEDFAEALRCVNQSRDLAPAQAKLMEFFQRILQIPEPLPRGILNRVWVALSDRKLNIREDQVKALLSAIEARASQPKTAEESKELASARSNLLREFPTLRTEDSPQNAIVATNYWLTSESAPSALRSQIGFHPEAAVWHDHALWDIDPFAGRLWRIQPDTKEYQIFDAANRPKAYFGSHLVVWGEQMAITTENGISVLDKDRTAWKEISLPPARYTIGVSGKYLWAASGDRPTPNHDAPSTGVMLYRISPDLTTELIASSRRRPAQHPLDETLRGEPFVILPAENDGVIVGARGNGWPFLDSNTGQPPPRLKERFVGNVRLSSNPQIVVRCNYSSNDRNRLARVELFTPQGNFLLLSHPKKDKGQNPRFAFPAELDDFPATEFTVAWDGTTLSVLAWSSEGSPWGAAHARLFCIRDGGFTGAPVVFKWDASIEARVRAARHDPKVVRYPNPDAEGLISTDKGLVLTGRGMWGYWFIPNSQLPREVR